MPEIVAHRGDAEHFPENSLAAIESAWRGGLRFVELDVQLSRDGVPYVIHDPTLERTTGRAGDVRRMLASELDGVGDGTLVPRLAAVTEALRAREGARAFVEVKRASLEDAGRERCMAAVLATIAPVAARTVVISFDAAACRIARDSAGIEIGWVLPESPEACRDRLDALDPQFAFCDHRRMGGGAMLPGGGWRWVAYEVVDARHALALGRRGIAMVESMAPFRLARDLEAAGAAT